ncbi:mitochondrial protein C2orf69 homolog isoform X2 [Pseudoliparis swirei]|nr:mitochondrial protein C2orf69 homolog isoform X2 [Pseudoliparis swirei]XP_056281214.1 mitochondrial protein C2orf69 homolog isoform X2 [Pseudoliparis swirei]XP_056281223.1 mitochondrial protein C2orf69 homolog isoform X2 [Pseudoliparis swirei]
MLAPRAAVAQNMTSATSSSEAPGLSASASRGARAGSPRQRLQKLLSVPGYDPSRVNDLLLLRPDADHRAAAGPEEEGRNRHVVFFHGDIQNFEEEMSLRPEGAQWLSWSLERVALTLGRRFPDRHVWVVRAGRMYLHMFSSYRNFVESNMFGAPEHSAYSSGSGAFLQLRALLSHGMERAGPPTPPRPEGGAAGLPSGFSLAVVGFSKGCVVLNQMVYELAGARGDPRLRRFVDAVSDMYWLDGGHPGGSETWVTDAPLLKELAASGVSVHAHVTPYEVRDPARAWVGREHGRFIDTLEEFGARLTKKLHFEDEPPSIENHFRVIQEF